MTFFPAAMHQGLTTMSATEVSVQLLKHPGAVLVQIPKGLEGKADACWPKAPLGSPTQSRLPELTQQGRQEQGLMGIGQICTD